MFISNNCGSFNFWGKENLVKHHKVSKYYENDSGQSLINKNCHSSKTGNDFDMNLGPVTKFDKRNTTASEKSEIDFISTNCDVIVI